MRQRERCTLAFQRIANRAGVPQALPDLSNQAHSAGSAEAAAAVVESAANGVAAAE